VYCIFRTPRKTFLFISVGTAKIFYIKYYYYYYYYIAPQCSRTLFLAILLSIHAESDPSVTSPGFDGFSNKKRNNRETSARDSHYYDIIMCSRFWRAAAVRACCYTADVPHGGGGDVHNIIYIVYKTCKQISKLVRACRRRRCGGVCVCACVCVCAYKRWPRRRWWCVFGVRANPGGRYNMQFSQ